MKKIIAFLSFLVVFTSCSNDDSIIQEETNLEIKESTALRLSLANIKQASSPNGKYAPQYTTNNEPTELCFQFDYPVVLEYNTGTQITVTDFPQLLDILLNETLAVHITSIGFPFDVIQYSDNSSLTINDEAGFQSLVVGCGYDPVTVSQIVALTDNCFDVVYPVTVLVDEVPHTFDNQTEAENYFLNNIQSITSLNMQYPFSVIMVDTMTEAQINNDFELINLINTTCNIN